MPARRPVLLLAPLLMTAPAVAAPSLPVLPPLALPFDRPFVTATIAGQPVTLRVDPGADPYIVLTPAAARRLALAADARPDGKPPSRGELQVQVGQTQIGVPYSQEAVGYAGFSVRLRVVTPGSGDFGGADGVVSPTLLPHSEVRLVRRPATAGDRTTVLKAETRGLFFADTIQADWKVPAGKLELEFHPFRATTIASVAAASRLADSFGGQLQGAVHPVEIAYGVARPVRTMALARPAAIAGIMLSRFDVRLFDWSGSAELPPDADPDAPLTVTASRGRQRGWPILKLGADVLADCAEITWRRTGSEMALTCPAPATAKPPIAP